MADMIETVARALDPTAWEPFSGAFREFEARDRKIAARDNAVRALLAMREPTDEMVTAGGFTNYNNPFNSAYAMFQAMIDTALKTEEKTNDP